MQVDVPRTVGDFGGIGPAPAVGVIEAAFIAAVPMPRMLRMLGKAALPQPVRFVSDIVDGAAQRVGGQLAGTV
jgi:hypothetical protein